MGGDDKLSPLAVDCIICVRNPSAILCYQNLKFLALSRHCGRILCLRTKFRANRTNRCKVITRKIFSNMAAVHYIGY